jgi:hypothetical protein
VKTKKKKNRFIRSETNNIKVVRRYFEIQTIFERRFGVVPNYQMGRILRRKVGKEFKIRTRLVHTLVRCNMNTMYVQGSPDFTRNNRVKSDLDGDKANPDWNPF